ncbi:hypothetical protein LCIT_06960 [Leuconostoc citreum]|uniref:Uncharacterized protein n=1 Tax=Leuconostoc citreum TaxID=33964 RepID=A0A5A5U143_LEUCI|nr:KxYKxGKxW signal peptide domain-containing protein [Leuconostoc citreum]GDZ83454.1 hypothetical protein LCIT_06960 [Leuconostoc citreum]
MEKKLRYKMYKSGKHWIFVGLMSLFAITGSSYVTQKVSADEISIEKSNNSRPANLARQGGDTTDTNSIKSTEKQNSNPDTSANANNIVTNNKDPELISDSTKKNIETNDNDTANQKKGLSTNKDYTHVEDNSSNKDEKSQQKIQSEKYNNDVIESSKSDNSTISLEGTQDIVSKKDDHNTNTSKDNSQQYIIKKSDEISNLNAVSLDHESKIDTDDSKSIDTKITSSKLQNLNALESRSDQTSISDPLYPNNMWKDPNKDRFTFNYLLRQDHNQQLVFSTDRSGLSGNVYVYLINNQSQKIIEQATLNTNTQITLQNNGVTIFNDNFSGVVWSNNPQMAWSREYSVNGAIPGKLFGKITYFVPKLITQTVKFVDENGNNIIDSNGKIVNPIVQQGLTGQLYKTSGPSLVNGFYAGHYQINPENASGTMSQFGVPGSQYTRDFHDGYKIVFTEIDGNGLMNAKILDPQGKVVYENNNLAKDQSDDYSDNNVKLTVSNPYVTQTRNVIYVYKTLGSLVPDVPGSTPVPYPNDPSDPSKPGNPTIPDIPGYTPVDPTGKPLNPGDAYPVDPSKPGADTPIHYQANDQKANVTYIDQTTGQTIKADQLTGKSDQTSDYRTKASIDQFTKQGYELVSDDYPANGVVFDRDDQKEQNYTVVLKHKTTIVTPENPGQPGEPIDPNNPTGPKYPEGTDKTALHREINQTINYVDEQGKTVATSVKDQVSFDRTGTVDQVTGVVNYTEWQAKNQDNVFDAKQSPVIKGYYADKGNITAQTVTPDTADQIETVTYHQLGSLVPDVPGSTPVPYPNDPSDPSKPGNPTIPDIPGYTPVDPTGKPLNPGDAYPVDPSKPGADTPIHYIKIIIPNKGIDSGEKTPVIDINDNGPKSTNKDIYNGNTTHDIGISFNNTQLPKTNVNNSNNNNALIISAIGSALGLLGYNKLNKKRKENQ